MNEIAKKTISERLEVAIDAEGLSRASAARFLGISPAYVSMMCNPKQWNKCSHGAWEVARKWTNSGLKLSQFNPEKIEKLTRSDDIGDKPGNPAPDAVEEKPGIKLPGSKISGKIDWVSVAQMITDFMKWDKEKHQCKCDNSKVEIEIDIVIKINGKPISL